VVEKNGLKVGFLAFTRYENLFHNPADPAQPHVPLVHYDDDHQSGGIDERALLPKVKAAAAKCDALIVLPHWGDEYQPRPRPEDRQLARQLVEAGAVAVVGSHPHVVQPVEAVARPDGSEAVVAFSLGNLLSNQDFNDGDSPKREGLLLKLTLSREGTGPVKLERAEPLAVWMKNAFRPRRQLGPVVVDDELLAVRAELSSLGTAATPAARAEQARLAAELAHLQRRRDAIYARVPLALRPPPPPTEGAAARP
jgi:poly-gamma-glutamate capsule biosynthesis protein CapA/YwtB (metallophosphatase superfamily)